MQGEECGLWAGVDQRAECQFRPELGTEDLWEDFGCGDVLVTQRGINLLYYEGGGRRRRRKEEEEVVEDEEET